MLDPAELKATIALAVESRLPQAIHDATGELVDAIVKAEIATKYAPTIMKSFMEAGERDLMKNGGRIAGLGNGFHPDDYERVDALVKGDGGGGDGVIGKRDDGSPIVRGRLSQNVDDPRGLLYDPFTALDQLGFRERPSAMTYRTLAEMARKVPPYAAILQTRINQIASFAMPQPDEHSVGFKVVLRDRRTTMSKDLQRIAYQLTRWVTKCGNPDVKKRRKGFEEYLRMSTWDSLAYDQGTTEIVNDKQGKPSYWRALDAATIRISDDLDDDDEESDSVRYVQVHDDTIVAEFEDRHMVFGVRNPRSDIRFAGYGQSELELLIVIVTALLWGIDYNAKFFKQGTVAKGVLNFRGAIPDKELTAFRRQWYAMISGVENAWRTPVVNAEDLQWVSMQTSNRDMEFAQWIDWLLKITCAIMQIAPEEIGFQFGNGGQSSSMGEGNQEQKLKFSKDKGLIPLARFHASNLNKIIERIDDRFAVEFAGVNARTAEELIDLQTKEVSTIKMVDEVRKERGMRPLAGGKGQVILNPVWQAMAQAMAQGGGAGAPGVPQGAGMDQGGLDGQQGDDQQEDGEDGDSQDPNNAGSDNGGDPTDDDVDQSMEKAFAFLKPKPGRTAPSSARREPERPRGRANNRHPALPRGRILDLEVDL